jgi:4-aminobutyrate aminotransferase-like enzyme
VIVLVQAYRIINTWLGDLSRLVTLEALLKEIQEKDLLSMARLSGEVLLSGLRALEVRKIYPSVLPHTMWCRMLIQS